MGELSFSRVLVEGFGLYQAEFHVGCHTVLCDPARAGATFVALATGELGSDHGKVLIGGRAPASRPDLRRRIGSLAPEAVLPHGATVHDALRTIAKLRGQAVDWSAELATWGIESWLKRRSHELHDDERRAVALVAALSVVSPLAILLYEPFSEVAALDLDEVCARLHTASEAAVVVVATGQPQDAQRLAGSTWLLRPGRIEALDPTLLAPERSGAPICMRIRCGRPRDLVAELALRQDVQAVAFNATSGDSAVWIRGSDARALSLSLLQAAHDTGASLESWEIVQVPLPVIAAAHDGSLRAAYERAWQAAQGHSGYWRHGVSSRGHGGPNAERPPARLQASDIPGAVSFVPPPLATPSDVVPSLFANRPPPTERIDPIRQGLDAESVEGERACAQEAVDPRFPNANRGGPS